MQEKLMVAAFLTCVLILAGAAPPKGTECSAAAATEQDVETVVKTVENSARSESGDVAVDQIASERAKARLKAEKEFYTWVGWWNWWQLIGTALGVTVALLIAGAGAVFAYLQLRRGPESTTELKVGPTGVEVSTKVIGIAVLVLAYLFFQVAAKHAFEMELQQPVLSHQAAAGAGAGGDGGGG